ncbi:MAG: radical SAM protein [Euryarchaeota archaeon]|nr:radical SAM protein [Euryarchaeota archaeon]
MYLERRCEAHGAFSDPFWEDADQFRRFLGSEPRVEPGSRALAVKAGHACVAVLEVTERCNLECDYCFASSGPQGRERSAEEVGRLLEVVLESSGAVPLQLSGGEPTVHPKLADLARLARAKGFGHIEVNTNGIRIAGDAGYAEQLKAAGVSTLYLQFDALSDDVYAVTRGRPLLRIKLQAIERAREAGLSVTLVPTVVPGVNEDRLGEIVRFALENLDVVRAVNFQPVARFGRHGKTTLRLSVGAVSSLLARQVPGLRETDIVPVPCCSAFCSAATVILKTPAGPVPLTRFVSPGVLAEVLSRVREKDYLEVMASTQRGRDRVVEIACACALPVPGAAGELLKRSLTVSIMGFMDLGSADTRRLMNCCVGVPDPKGGLVPFCAYNMTDEAGKYVFRERLELEGRRCVS